MLREQGAVPMLVLSKQAPSSLRRVFGTSFTEGVDVANYPDAKGCLRILNGGKPMRERIRHLRPHLSVNEKLIWRAWAGAVRLLANQVP